MTRFAQTTASPVLSQVLRPLAIAVVTALGIFSTSAAVQIFPEETTLLWAPFDLLEAFMRYGGRGARAGAFFAGLAFVAGQLCINVTGNGYKQGVNLSSLFPRYINPVRGAFVISFLGLAINPWKLASQAQDFLTVLSGMGLLYAPASGLQ